MVKVRRGPQVGEVPVHAIVTDGEDLQRFSLLIHGLRHLHNVWQIRVQHHFLVLLVETELEGSNLGAEGGVEIARVVEVLGFNLSTHQNPVEINAVEHVGDLFVAFHGDGEVLFFVGLADLEPVRVGRDFAAQVNLRGLVDLVADEAVKLVDDHGELGREAIEEASDAGEEELMDFVWKEVLDY